MKNLDRPAQEKDIGDKAPGMERTASLFSATLRSPDNSFGAVSWPMAGPCVSFSNPFFLLQPCSPRSCRPLWSLTSPLHTRRPAFGATQLFASPTSQQHASLNGIQKTQLQPPCPQ